MPLLKNRIGLSLLVILLGACLWEFYGKPATGPLYAVAVNDYRNGHSTPAASPKKQQTAFCNFYTLFQN
jgi:hypothetical protein